MTDEYIDEAPLTRFGAKVQAFMDGRGLSLEELADSLAEAGYRVTPTRLQKRLTGQAEFDIEFVRGMVDALNLNDEETRDLAVAHLDTLRDTKDLTEQPRNPEARLDDALGIRRGLEGEENHCIVRHPEAGGQCENLAEMTVYGLPFCQRHGEECELSAKYATLDDAAYISNEYAHPLVNNRIEYNPVARRFGTRWPTNMPSDWLPVSRERRRIWGEDPFGTADTPVLNDTQEDFDNSEYYTHLLMLRAYEYGPLEALLALEYARESYAAKCIKVGIAG